MNGEEGPVWLHMVFVRCVVMQTVTHMVTVVYAQTKKVPCLGSQEGVPLYPIYSMVSPCYSQLYTEFSLLTIKKFCVCVCVCARVL